MRKGHEKKRKVREGMIKGVQEANQEEVVLRSEVERIMERMRDRTWS